MKKLSIVGRDHHTDAHGTAEEATRAREIISRTDPEALEEHQPSRAIVGEPLVAA